MFATPQLQLSLSSRPENVAVVRQALSGLAEAYALHASVVLGMKLAATEACTNVVLHAYRDREGPGSLEVESDVGDEEATIVVRDFGVGMLPRSDSPGIGLGLPLIAALAETMEVRGVEDGGTEISMTFNLSEAAEETASP